MPEVVINPVATLEVERPVSTIAESDIDAMVESMRRQRISYSPVERAAAKGDRVVVDFAGRVDGAAFEGGTGTDFAVVIGAGRAIADFEAALVGMSKGEARTAPVKFPENYGAPNLAGKEAEFDLTVKSVEEEVLPPVDDAFAQAFGIAEGGVKALREEVLKNMEREAGEAVRVKLRTQVFEALLRDNSFDLPRSLVDEQIQQMQIDLLQRMGRQDLSQMPPREPFEEPARRRVKLGLLIGELVRRESLKIERERLFARLEEVASGYPNPDEVKRAYLQNQDAMRQIETAVMEDMAVEWVLGRARVTDRPTSFADLTGFGRQA
jgi:trigger factor